MDVASHPTRPRPDFSRVDLASVLSPAGVEFVQAVRSGTVRRGPPMDDHQANEKFEDLRYSISRRISLAKGKWNGTPEAQQAAKEQLNGLRSELLQFVLQYETQLTAYAEPLWRLAIQDAGSLGHFDLVLAPIRAGAPPAPFTSDTPGRLTDMAAWEGWPHTWFEIVGKIYGAPEPTTHRMLRVALKLQYSFDFSAPPQDWSDYLRRVQQAALHDREVGRDIEWERSVPGAIPVLTLFALAFQEPLPDVPRELVIETLDALLDAGAAACAAHCGRDRQPLITMMSVAQRGGRPLAARVIERHPGIEARVQGFGEAHETMRTRLIEKGDIDQANSIVALLMKRAALAQPSANAIAPPSPAARPRRTAVL